MACLHSIFPLVLEYIDDILYHIHCKLKYLINKTAGKDIMNRISACGLDMPAKWTQYKMEAAKESVDPDSPSL